MLVFYLDINSVVSLLLLEKNKLSNQPRLGQTPTVELDKYVPAFTHQERQESLVWGVISFLCPHAEAGISADEHIFSLHGKHAG